MADDDGDLIPPRPPPRKNTFAVIPAICAIVGLAIFHLWNQDRDNRLRTLLDEGIELRATGRQFSFFDAVWRRFDEYYLLEGNLIVIDAESNETINLNSSHFYALCGEVLTKVASLSDAPAGRNEVFRLTLRLPVVENGELTGKYHGNTLVSIPIDDGACPTQEDMEKVDFHTYPGALRDWGLIGFFDFESDSLGAPKEAAVFASRNGKMSPPLPFAEACRAAIFDLDYLWPNSQARPEKLAVLFLGEIVTKVEEPRGEPGLAQYFEIEDGQCEAASEVRRLTPDN